jgi:hypothetical protein
MIDISELHKELMTLMTKCAELPPSDRQRVIIQTLTTASKELHMLHIENITKTDDDGNTEGI